MDKNIWNITNNLRFCRLCRISQNNIYRTNLYFRSYLTFLVDWLCMSWGPLTVQNFSNRKQQWLARWVLKNWDKCFLCFSINQFLFVKQLTKCLSCAICNTFITRPPINLWQWKLALVRVVINYKHIYF